MFNSNKEKLIKLIEEIWNKGNLDLVNELVSDRYEIKHDPGDPWESKVLNHEAFKNRVILTRNIFPDLKFDIQDFVCEKNKISISWYMSGTQIGSVPNLLPATGKSINASGLTIYYFSEGKISRHWQVFDRLTFLERLGVKIGTSGKD